MTKFIVLAALGSMMALPATVSAQEAPQVTVQTNDLDLTSEAGQRTLDRRISAAMRAVCKVSGRDLNAIRARAECRETALASASAEKERAIAMAKFSAERLAQSRVENTGA